MARRLIAVSLVVCLLASLLTVAPVAAQENDTLNAEFPDCETMRVTGNASYAEVYTSSYTEQGGFDTDVISVELSGDETVITEDDLYDGDVGSYQDEFVIDGVALFESDTGPMIGDFNNPNRQSCFDSLPQPPENTDDSSTTAEPTTSTATATPTTASTTTPTTTSATTPTTTSATTPTTSAATDSTNSPQQTTATETTAAAAPQDAETSTPSQNGASDTTATEPQDSGASQGPAPGDAVAGDEADGSTSVPFSVNASSGANETLVTYNVTGVLVNATDDATVTANASEQAPNGTRAPTVEDDGFRSLSYLAVNATADETAVENLSVVATVNASYLATLGGNASDVQFHAWDAANDTWVPVNTSVANVTANASVGNATADTVVANASHVFEADIGYGVYALGLNRSHVVVTNVTAPENASVGETVTVEATVENTGRANGTHTATFSVAGNQVDESVVTLGANESTVVEFDWQFETAGTHTVAVDNETVDVNVSAAGDAVSTQDGDSTTDSTSSLQLEAPGSLNRLGVGVVVAPLALAGGAVVALHRR